MNPIVKTALLLVLSNAFMICAWYGPIKFLQNKPLLVLIVLSWSIAFIEYCIAIPANRIGGLVLSGFQLKIMQEVITLIVFVVFARFVLGEKFRWNHAVSFLFLAAAAYFAFAFRDADGPFIQARTDVARQEKK